MPAGIRGLTTGQRAVLLLSECQRGMLDPEVAVNPALAGQACERGIVDKIAALATACRASGVPVIHNTYVPPAGFVGYVVNNAINARVLRDGRLQPGSVYVEIPSALAPQEGDIRIERSAGLSLFHETALDTYLSRFEIETVILVGVSTNIALFGAALEAVNRGYQVVLAEDCSAGATKETHRFQVEEQFPLLAAVVDSTAIVRELRNNRISIAH